MHPAQPTGTDVVTSIAKRFACDRCRDLKLRCPRNFEDEPCERCLRVDAHCVTSSGRPLGRRPGQAESHVDVAVCHASRHPQYKRQRVTEDSPATITARKRGGAPGASATASHSPTKSMHVPYQHHPSLLADAGLSKFDGMPDMQMEDIHNPYDLLDPNMETTGARNQGNGFATGPGDPPPFVESLQWSAHSHPNWEEFCDHDDIGAPDMQPSLYGEAHSNNCARRDTTNTSRNSRSGTDTGSTTPRLDSDWTMPLINALGSISRQLAELRMQACHLPSQAAGACTFEGITPNLDFLDTPLYDGASDASLRTTLLGKAVVATMRFILVLQMMAPTPVDWTGFVSQDGPSGATGDAASRPMSSRSSSQPVSSANAAPQVTLIILSTYLQLGELFDIILSPTVQFLEDLANVALDPGAATGTRVCDQMLPAPSDPQQSCPGTSATDPRSPTAAQRVAQPRSQDILMTIRVVEHQLNTLERLIGLPEQYCLVGRKDASADVIYSHDSSVLAKAVMRQALQTLLSLKKTLDCIQTAVRRRPI